MYLDLKKKKKKKAWPEAITRKPPRNVFYLCHRPKILTGVFTILYKHINEKQSILTAKKTHRQTTAICSAELLFCNTFPFVLNLHQWDTSDLSNWS